MKMNNFFFLLIAGTLFSIKLFSQDNGQEIIPCQEIKIMCSQVHPSENVIRNNVEYQKLLNVRSPHPDCGSYTLPEIDFNQYTLLGIDLYLGGCKEPAFTHSLMKLPDGNYKFIVNIKEYGYCKMGFSQSIWCLIPKIDETVSVEFIQEIKIEE